MLLSEHKDLKLAIRSLPEKEKDKLLLRLVAKDKVLTEHLHFKLLENEQDLSDRCEALMKQIDSSVAELLDNRKLTSKDTLAKMRALSGQVNHHFKVTRDAGSDVELRIHLLNLVPIAFKESLFSPLHKFNEKLMVYFVKSAQGALNKYYKLHEDLQFDMKEKLEQVLYRIYTNKTEAVARELGLPKEL